MNRGTLPTVELLSRGRDEEPTSKQLEDTVHEVEQVLGRSGGWGGLGGLVRKEVRGETLGKEEVDQAGNWGKSIHAPGVQMQRPCGQGHAWNVQESAKRSVRLEQSQERGQE